MANFGLFMTNLPILNEVLFLLILSVATCNTGGTVKTIFSCLLVRLYIVLAASNMVEFPAVVSSLLYR